MPGDPYSAEYYSARESWLDWRLEAKTLIRLACLKGHERALEIGCGSGGLLKLLGRQPALAAGADTLMSALQLARGRSDIIPGTYLVQIAPRGPLPFAAASFHAILAQHVIEHVEHLSDTLGEWRRVLRPQGRLLIATPNALYPDPSHFKDDEHVCVFAPHELVSRLERSGFAVESASTMFPFLTRLRPLRAVGVSAYPVFQQLPYFKWRGRTLIVAARVT